MTTKRRMMAAGLALLALVVVMGLGFAVASPARADVPEITKVSPDSGPLAGGNYVTLKGTGFNGAGLVIHIGSQRVSGYGADGTTILSFKVPAGAKAGSFHIRVANAEGTSEATEDDLYTYEAPVPVVQALSPSSGSIDGGASVRIEGTGLTDATAVTFGDKAAKHFKVESDGLIVVTSPAADSPGEVSIRVTTSGGTSKVRGVSCDTFLYKGPVVSAVLPKTGGAAGGAEVIIAGKGLNDVTAVAFGKVVTSSFQMVPGGKTLYVTSPPSPHVGKVHIRVTTADGTSGAVAGALFEYQAPTVDAVDPDRGSVTGGDKVYVRGADFMGATAVTFGKVAAPKFEVKNDRLIVATTPAAAQTGSVHVRVTTPEGTSPTNDRDAFTYKPAERPLVKRVTPYHGPITGGTQVTITGENFLGATAVKFGETPAKDFWVKNDHAVIATSPAVASGGEVQVTVITPDGPSAWLPDTAFEYRDPNAPIVTRVAPETGSLAGVTEVHIFGKGFDSATAVTVGGTPARSFTVDSDTRITAVVPAAANPGTVDVRVTARGATSNRTFTTVFKYLLPVVQHITPDAGEMNGGTKVRIKGEGFEGASAVAFGSTPASSFTVVSDELIEAVAPAADDVRSVLVKVTVAGAKTGYALRAWFKYEGPRMIGVAPRMGPYDGGNTVRIEGSGFKHARAVLWGPTILTDFKIVSDELITVAAPSGGVSVQVRVLTPEGTTKPVSMGWYAYGPPPIVTQVLKNHGPVKGGYQVFIIGSGFQKVAELHFGKVEVPRKNYTVDSDSLIIATVPRAAAAGTVDVVVSTFYGTSPSTDASKFQYQAPVK